MTGAFLAAFLPAFLLAGLGVAGLDATGIAGLDATGVAGLDATGVAGFDATGVAGSAPPVGVAQATAGASANDAMRTIRTASIDIEVWTAFRPKSIKTNLRPRRQLLCKRGQEVVRGARRHLVRVEAAQRGDDLDDA